MLDFFVTLFGVTLLLWGVRLCVYSDRSATRRVVGFSAALWATVLLSLLWRS